MPTLSLSYSVKAVGINQDIFGHQEFCQSVKKISADKFAHIMGRMIEESTAIRTHLAAKIPEIQSRALSAGRILWELLKYD